MWIWKYVKCTNFLFITSELLSLVWTEFIWECQPKYNAIIAYNDFHVKKKENRKKQKTFGDKGTIIEAHHKSTCRRAYWISQYKKKKKLRNICGSKKYNFCGHVFDICRLVSTRCYRENFAHFKYALNLMHEFYFCCYFRWHMAYNSSYNASYIHNYIWFDKKKSLNLKHGERKKSTNTSFEQNRNKPDFLRLNSSELTKNVHPRHTWKL